MYIVALAKPRIMSIYPFYKAQVILLISTEIFIKYSNFLDNFFLDSATKLLKYTGINDYSINLLKDK